MFVVVALTRTAADLGCDRLEEAGILDRKYRNLRRQEVSVVTTTNHHDAMLRGVRLTADDVAFVDGWERGRDAPQVMQSLALTLGMEREGLEDCATVVL